MIKRAPETRLLSLNSLAFTCTRAISISIVEIRPKKWAGQAKNVGIIFPELGSMTAGVQGFDDRPIGGKEGLSRANKGAFPVNELDVTFVAI